MAQKKKSPKMKDIEKDVLKNIGRPGFEDDDEYDADADERNRGQRITSDIAEEIKMDEIFTGLTAGNGFFLMLQKEVDGNTWQTKRRIDSFQQWSCAEMEVMNIVRAETKKEIMKWGRVRKWGSGNYRLVIWRDGGWRGVKRDPIYFNVDANEEEYLSEAPTGSGSGIDISDITQVPVEQMTSLFKSGLEAGGGKGGDSAMLTLMMNQQNENNRMMMGILTALITKGDGGGIEKTLALMSTMGVMNKPKSIVEQISELKAIGIDIAGKSNDDISEMAKKVETIKSVAGMLGLNAGAEPSFWSSLLNSPIVSKIPDMLNNAAVIASAKMAATPPARDLKPPVVIEENKGVTMLDFIYNAINTNDVTAYGRISEMLAPFVGGIDNLRKQAQSPAMNQMLTSRLAADDPRYRDVVIQNKMKVYVSSYLDSLRKPVSQPQPAKTVATCDRDPKHQYEFEPGEYEAVQKENGGRVLCEFENCAGELLVKVEV